ncbi:MAG: 4-(cytidine 5'-diphospho)-2-C-methyl-D-erythritol kinase [Lachnospiraceae bacterium]|nr:4-(cytidine 5'-diphospho)-2-C-methyl-D-erythritol kinase [Lachnospiraceae bacterium]
MKLFLRAYAKINPYLNITGRREDGYHELDIIFRPVTLYDELEMELTDGAGVKLVCDRADLTEDNIICKAYERLKEETGVLPGFAVTLHKNIPSGAGMGGGSSDAAAFLWGANVLAGLGLSQAELMKIGAAVGADVPACLLQRVSAGEGIGERLCVIEGAANVSYLIIKPQESFSTPAMYGEYDRLAAAGKIRTGNTAGVGRGSAAVMRAIAAGDAAGEAKRFYNVFEKTVPDKRLISSLKKLLISAGARGALMTGSGSCVVGAFLDERSRNAAYRKLLALQKKEDRALQGCTFYRCKSLDESRELNYVYMVRCGDGSLYTGWTKDPEKRFAAHSSGRGAKYTRSRGARELVYLEAFDSKRAALAREYAVKQLTRDGKIRLAGLQNPDS